MNDHLTIIGNIAADPATATLPNGTPVVRLRVATNHRRFDRGRGEWVEGETNWFTVIAYRALAEHAGISLTKGQRVIASGRLRVRSWAADNGARGTEVELLAEALGPDLLFGTCTFARSASPLRTTPSEPPSDQVSTTEVPLTDAWDVAIPGANLEEEPVPF